MFSKRLILAGLSIIKSRSTRKDIAPDATHSTKEHNLDSMFLKPSAKHPCLCLLQAMCREVLLADKTYHQKCRRQGRVTDEKQRML